jgi:predicted DNA-binding protein YlxM (UPF0122 family)
VSYANPNRQSAYITDRRHQKRDERLDSYAAAVMLDPVATPEDIILAQEQCDLLSAAMFKHLTPRECLAIRLYYGLNVEPMTLEQVGERFDVSRTRINQIIHKALRKLRSPRNIKKFFPERLKVSKREEARQEARQAARLVAHRVYETPPQHETPPPPPPPFHGFRERMVEEQHEIDERATTVAECRAHLIECMGTPSETRAYRAYVDALNRLMARDYGHTP